MAEYLDIFNFMSYDIHGTWDGSTKWTQSVVNPHTNLTGMFDFILCILPYRQQKLTIENRGFYWPGPAMAEQHRP